MLCTSLTTITRLAASSAAGDSGSRLIKISQLVHQSRLAEQVLGQCIGHRADCEDGKRNPRYWGSRKKQAESTDGPGHSSLQAGSQLPAPKRMALTPREARPGWCRICQTGQGSPRGDPNPTALHGGGWSSRTNP